MKVFVNRILMNVNDEPFTVQLDQESAPDKVTLGMVIRTALQASVPEQDNNPPQGWLIQRARIARAIERKRKEDKGEGAFIDVSVDHVALVKQRMEALSKRGPQGLEAFLVVAAFDAIDGEDTIKLA